VVVGHGDVDDVIALLHRALDPRVVAEHDVYDDELTRTWKQIEIFFFVKIEFFFNFWSKVVDYVGNILFCKTFFL